MQPRYYTHLVRGWLGTAGLFGKLHPPLLVVGSQNSGTTALGEAIAVHPEIENRSEARTLWDPHFHDRDHDMLKVAADATPADIRRLRGNFCYFQWATRKTLVMNKHPENAFRIHFMKAIFPEAKLINIVRDGRAAVCSNYRSATTKENRMATPFAGYSRPPGWREQLDRPILEQLSYMWNESVMYASTEGAKYGADFMEVRYEDLPLRSGEIMSQIWRWIGLEVRDEYVAALPKFDDRNYKWKQALKPEEVATIERVAKPGLERFGYR
jgi:hypothetical protein